SHPPDRLRALREAETLEAVAALGLGPEHVRFLRLPDGGVPRSGPEAEAAADAIVAAADETAAGAVFVTWGHDPHCDHKASAAIVTLAQARLGTTRVFAYPIWGWTLPDDLEVGAAPSGHRLDITAHLPAKAAAIAAHRSQITDLIADDPDAFRLEPAMLARFARPHEIFVAMPPDATA
ncbi:MAG TPA: PIG-L family deacetylase, partial [Geminicoccaceae bacterium]